MVMQLDIIITSTLKVEDVSRPGGETLGKHKGVKVIWNIEVLQFTSQLWDSIKLIVSTQDPEGPDSNLASLMAHEDADTVKKAKKSQ